MFKQNSITFLKWIQSRSKLLIFWCLLIGALLMTVYHSATILQVAETLDGWGAIAAFAIDVGIAAGAYLIFDTTIEPQYRWIAGIWALGFIAISDGFNTSYYLHHESKIFTLWELSEHDTAYIAGLLFPVAAAIIGTLVAGITASYRETSPKVRGSSSRRWWQAKSDVVINNNNTANAQAITIDYAQIVNQVTAAMQPQFASMQEEIAARLQNSFAVKELEQPSNYQQIPVAESEVVPAQNDLLVAQQVLLDVGSPAANSKSKAKPDSKKEQAQKLFADGLLISEIAAKIGVAEWTVKYKYLKANEQN